MSSSALYYLDQNGEKQDRDIHEAWLAAGDAEAATRIGIAAARRAGLTEAQIQSLYGRQAAADGHQADAMPPRPLYVRRDVVNADEILSHFADQGLEDLVDPNEMHVTVCYSETPVDWLKMGEAGWGQSDDGRVTVAPGGPRYVDRLGKDGEVIAQMFACSQLSYRHQEMLDRGATWSWTDYMPHIALVSDAAPEVDAAQIEPWRGPIVLGPEIFEDVRSS